VILAASSTHPWAWHAHPEVWLLVVGIVTLAVIAVRVIGPKVVAPGESVVSGRQLRAFAVAVVLLELVADWPLHDIGETYLYSFHMIQHALLTLVVAPLFLLATPTWLARLVIGDGWFGGKALRWLARPVPAGVIFNAVIVFSHWQNMVDVSVRYGSVHFGMHVLLFASALLMWMPVCGPLPELRISLPAQMLYLFLMSVVPTIPAAWLTFADGVVYKSYDISYRMFGLSAVTDQQLAGLFMKLVAGGYLWVLIITLFFKWSARNEEAERQGRKVTERDLLTWEQVQATFDALGPAPSDAALHEQHPQPPSPTA
jgi:putative membrane protein